MSIHVYKIVRRYIDLGRVYRGTSRNTQQLRREWKRTRRAWKHLGGSNLHVLDRHRRRVARRRGIAVPFLENGIRHIVLVDFEYIQERGEDPDVVCMVARDFITGETWRVWQDDLYRMSSPPFPCGRDSAIVAYAASAEARCFLKLGWGVPFHIYDLFTEFRCHTNGKGIKSHPGLTDAMRYSGLPFMTENFKIEMRNLVCRGGPWSDSERHSIMDYCEKDVTALESLLPCLLRTGKDFQRALLRGRFSWDIAKMETTGIPIDMEMFRRLEDQWDKIRPLLINTLDPGRRFFEGEKFSMAKMEIFVSEKRLTWPRTETGKLKVDKETFKDMAHLHATRDVDITTIGYLREILTKYTTFGLPVERDGRCRARLWHFSAITSRTQPPTRGFIFGRAAWFRYLIKPTEGYAIVYIDWCQQEFGLAAALSGDEAMLAAYNDEGGDPYMKMAIQAGAAPEGATKHTHPGVREQYKTAVLAIGYGMQSRSLADRLERPECDARVILEGHKRIYPQYWNFLRRVKDVAALTGRLRTVLGWQLNIVEETKSTTMCNFPIQGNGAEMLRLAIGFALDAGVTVCAPEQDALLIEAPLEEIEEAIQKTRDAMAKASLLVTDGVLKLRTDAHIVRYPDRYEDRRGKPVWEALLAILQELEK